MNTLVRLAALVEALYQRTLNGNMEWMISTIDGTFCTKVKSSLIEIKAEPAAFDSDIRISLFNSDGVQVDTFTDVFLSSAKPLSNRFNNYYVMMADLLDSARRNATGADKIVDDILNGLNAESIVKEVDKALTPKALVSFDSDLDDDVPF